MKKLPKYAVTASLFRIISRTECNLQDIIPSGTIGETTAWFLALASLLSEQRQVGTSSN